MPGYCSVGYPLKIQGINTKGVVMPGYCSVGYPLKIQGINTTPSGIEVNELLDIHLKFKALTPYKLEHNEFLLFITKN